MGRRRLNNLVQAAPLFGRCCHYEYNYGVMGTHQETETYY